MSTSLPEDAYDVVVVGAGLAGLNASLDLTAAGLKVATFEAHADVGGRVRTSVTDGYRLDHGFQLYNPAYPAGKRVFDYAALNLRAFTRGAVVSLPGRNWLLADPRKIPMSAVSALTAPVGSLTSKLRFAWYAAQCARSRPAELAARTDCSARVALESAGIGGRFIDSFVGPFLSGVFLEADLATSRRFLDLVLRSFVRGTPSVPATGMAALPRQLAARLPPETLFTQTRVDSIEGSPGALRLQTNSGQVKTRAVIVAVDPTSVSDLIPGFVTPAMSGVTTWYHAVDRSPDSFTRGRPALVVDGTQRGPLVDSVAISNAAPSYAPLGKVLISSSALGSHTTADSDSAAVAHAGRLHAMSTSGWELVGKFVIPNALPRKPSPLVIRQDVRLGEGKYIAGDHRDTPSIQGALISGRRAAAAVLTDLR
ncbi:MAG: hypothetical protein ACJAY5_000259 [Actinomycetes bacterium]